MGFDEMLTSARTCVGAHYTPGHGDAGAHDHPHRPHLLLGEEEDDARPPRRQKLLRSRVGLGPPPPPIRSDGVAEDAGCSWSGHSRKRKRPESSSSEAEEAQELGTEERGTRAGGVAAGSSARPVCSGCGTSRTPMWRRGPAGPKTLCNACGIRYRKMRRSGGGGPSSSTAAAASAGDDQQKVGAAAAAEEELVREQGEKLWRRQRRRREVLWMLLRESRRFAFGCGEEEAEAAVLLMAISSGLFVHTSH